VTEDYGQSVFVVPPLSYEDTFEPAIGPMQGTVELLRVDCSVVEELALQTGVMEITATGHASIRYFTNGDTEFPTALFEETTRCGGSQLRPPGTTPQP
jgi:hypothetical protein